MQAITPVTLVERFGATRRFWERRRPAMVRAGLLTKVGRHFFGDLERIAGAIAEGHFPGDPSPTAELPHEDSQER